MRGGLSHIAKRFSDTWNHMIIKTQVNTLYILMKIIYMVDQ